MAHAFTAQNFDQEVLQSPIPVLVDFTATWCGPCQALAPIIEQLSSEYTGKVKVGKVDIDDAQDLAMTYGIQSVPTVMVFRGGKPVEARVGLNPKSEYRAMLDSLVGAK